MRCVACNEPLKNREATRKGMFTGEYLDLCDKCYEPIQDLAPTMDSPFHSGFVEVKEITPERSEGIQGEENVGAGDETSER